MMSLPRRVLAQIVRSQSTEKRIVFRPFASLTQPYSTKAKQSSKAGAATKAAWEAADWPRPSEIPFQVKVANSVSLIGYVDAPIQFRTSPDGKHWAGTVITQHASSSSPPLWIPVLFEGDLAHIAAGHLKKNDYVHIAGQLTADPPAVDGTDGQANVQVMVHNVNFIEPSSVMRKSFTSKPQEVEIIDHSASTKKDGNSASSGWCDLLDNPEQWQDYRSKKCQKLVKPRHPDFKHKVSKLSLWLNDAPDWVLSRLKGQEFDVQIPESNTGKQSKADEFWEDLVKNPDKWWDNRLDKKSEKAPDFKHKETGKALWVAYSPAWVISELPPQKSEKRGEESGQVKSEKAPDFKHKETGKALWVAYSPAWVKSELPPRKSKKKAATGKRDTLLS